MPRRIATYYSILCKDASVDCGDWPVARTDADPVGDRTIAWRGKSDRKAERRPVELGRQSVWAPWGGAPHVREHVVAPDSVRVSGTRVLFCPLMQLPSTVKTSPDRS